MIFDSLIERIGALENPTVVGLDTAYDYLPDGLRAVRAAGSAKLRVRSLRLRAPDEVTFEDAAAGILAFNKRVVDAVCDIVPAVKVQIAYYEMYGPAGIEAFEQTLLYAKSKGLFVMTDAKRNDIGATASCYAKAYLGLTELGEGMEQAFPSDFLTVNGYLGTDGIKPFSDLARKFDRGIFVLVKTSNPSSGELQDLKLENGMTVYEYMGSLVEKWGEETRGKYGYSAVGAVVGATHPAQAAVLRKQMPHTFFLIPGYGAQGGTADDLKVCFGADGVGGIVNSSRGILCAYRKEQYAGMPFDEAARAACLDMRADLRRAVYGK